MLDPQGRPLWFTWDYTRSEIIADGVIHAVGVVLAVIGAIVLLTLSIGSASRAEFVAALVYTGGLVAVLGISAAYNLWPVSRCKWMLRRFDHAAIYLLIAGTYTPFLLQMSSASSARALLVVVWATAAAGIAMKLFLPGRFDGLSVAVYLLLGWSGVVAYDGAVAALPVSALTLLTAGGVLYSVGVIFHAWRTLRFQNAIWHGFVLGAALCHYFAVLETVALAG